MQPDPIGLEGGLNPYLYADGNPLRNVDPLGLQSRGREQPYYPGPFDPFTPGTPAYDELVDAGTRALNDFTQTCEAIGQAILDSIMLSKGGKQNVRDSGLAGLSDDEVKKRYDEATGPEKKRFEKELKARGLRNIKKR